MTKNQLQKEVERLQDIADNFLRLYEVLYRLKLGELNTLKYSWECLMTRLHRTRDSYVESAYRQGIIKAR